MTRKQKIFVFAPLAVIGFAAFIALGASIVQHLWNWLLPTIFGVRSITYWQALGVLILCRILFGGLRFGGHRGPGRHMAERWGKMSPEEREKFRQGIRGGWFPSEPQGGQPASS